MEPVPVFAIVGRALWFVFANLFTLVRLTWFPIAAFVATGWGLAYGVISENPGAEFDAIVSSRAYRFAAPTLLLLEGVAFSVVAVQVHRIILFGERSQNVYFAFPFGRTELAYVAMGALTFAVYIVFLAVIGIGVIAFVLGLGSGKGVSQALAFALTVAGKTNPSPAILVVAGLLTFALYIFMVWVLLRLTVWPPAVVANNRLALGEALRLTRGRVAAMLGLMLASIMVYIPIFALLGALSYWVSDDGIMQGLSATDFSGRIRLLLEGRIHPNAVAFEFAFQLFVTAYAVAVLSYTYKALKGFDADRPIDEEDSTLHLQSDAH